MGMNGRLDDPTRFAEMRRPIDVVAEGLLSEKKSGRQDTDRTFYRRRPGLGSGIAAAIR
jgi:hypothetical protein